MRDSEISTTIIMDGQIGGVSDSGADELRRSIRNGGLVEKYSRMYHYRIRIEDDRAEVKIQESRRSCLTIDWQNVNAGLF